MLPFKKILLPVDYSEPVVAIVPYVREMLRRFEGELALVHAYGWDGPGLFPIADPRLPEDLRALQDQRLRKFADTYFPGEKPEIFTGVGEAAHVIHDVVKHQGADLVMLPTHGNGPLRRMLLGSVTTKLLHDLTVPVWTAHVTSQPPTADALALPAAPDALTKTAGLPPHLPYKTILCAIDGPEEAEIVLRAGAALADTLDASLFLVSVIETPLAEPDMNYLEFRQELIAATDERLRVLKEKVGSPALHHKAAPHKVVDGLVPDEIRHEALRVGADLIVTGRGSAQGTFGRFWSHLYPIIRHAPCPVLSI